MFLLGDIYRRKYQKYKTVTNARNPVANTDLETGTSAKTYA